MSWKKSVRNGNFSPHEEEKNCFFAAFSFYLTDCAGKGCFSFFFAPLGVFCELTIFAYANDGGAVRGNRAAMSPCQDLSLNANGSKRTDRAASQ